MATYDSYETAEIPRRHRSHRHRDREEPRYQEIHETYVRGPVRDEYSSRQDLALRRDDSTIEEIERDFPPPGGRLVVRDERYGPPVQRARSADPREYHDYYDDPRRSERDFHAGRERHIEKKKVKRRRSLSRNEKILAGAAGLALAVGGKELFDRQKAKKRGDATPERNMLATAAVGAAGAFAAYEGAELYNKKYAHKETKERQIIAYDRDGNPKYEYYSEEEEHGKKKGLLEGAIGALGVGGLAKGLLGGNDKDSHHDGRRSRRGSDSSYSSRKSRRGKSPSGAAKYQQAAKAALMAGAAEAFRVRKEPGGWGGAKGRRILTAAIAGGGIGGAAAGDDPDHKSKRHTLEAVIGGLAGSRLLNGSRKELDVDADGRSIRDRSRSRARSKSRGGLPLGALGTAALGALAVKKATSRSRSRRRSDSEDSRDHGRRKRSKSVTDRLRGGMAALGLGGDDRRDDRRGGRYDDDYDRRHDRRRSRRRDSSLSSDDEYDRRRSDRHRDRSRGGDRDRDARNRRVALGQQNVSDSDSLGSSSGDEKRIKKMRGKQFITAGLASVATIHAAHGVYQSYEKRKAGHKAVVEGEISEEQARRQKAKMRLQDAASIAIAALGIKGAVSGECASLLLITDGH
jgi:uncharacterized membrane protein YsdA (DUF1294 family)